MRIEGRRGGGGYLVHTMLVYYDDGMRFDFTVTFVVC